MTLQSVVRGVVAGIFGAAVVVLAVTPIDTTPAQAATDCDSTVVDNAQVLGDGIADVQTAAEDLEKNGADVRVMTIQSFAPSGTIDAYLTDRKDACPSWQSPNGEPKSNLLVFAVSMDEHKVAILYGETWKSTFTGVNSETRIYDDFMTPQFKGGNFSQGFVDGMNEASRVIYNHLHPSETSPETSSGDGTAGWVVLFIFLGLLGAGAIGFVVWLLIRYFRRRGERRAARLEAIRARDAASRILHEVGDPNREAVRKAKIAKYSPVSEDVTARLEEALHTVNAAYGRATDGMESAASAEATADDKHLSIEEYGVLEASYTQVLDDAREAEAADKEIDDIAREVDDQQKAASASLGEAESTIALLETGIAKLAKGGIKTDTIQGSVDKAKTALEKAKGHSGSLAVIGDLQGLQQLVDGAINSSATLTAQRSQLKNGLPALSERIKKVTSQLDPAQKCFDRISKSYVESSWASITGNGTEATKRIEVAKVALADATEDADLKEQNWEAAVAKMLRGNELLSEAESLLRSIIALESNLAEAKKEAPAEIAAAEADIQKATEYIEAHQADVETNLKDDLERSTATLSEARKELGKDRPDYLLVVKLALQANAQADGIFEVAATEFENAERLRRQAVSSVRTAASAISKAEEYIEDHSSDVGGSASNTLNDAKDAFSYTKRNTEPSTIIKWANRAEELAEKAYEDARRDFTDAENQREQERERERRRRREREEASSYSSSSYSSSSSSWGSSSSSSGGGFGGSSGSFGGGGGGFGGSSGSW